MARLGYRKLWELQYLVAFEIFYTITIALKIIRSFNIQFSEPGLIHIFMYVTNNVLRIRVAFAGFVLKISPKIRKRRLICKKIILHLETFP